MNKNQPGQAKSGWRVGGAMLIGGFVLCVTLLSWLFSDWQARRESERLQPTSVRLDEGGDAVRLRRGARGHYMATGTINGESVRFMLDTGATSIAIPEQVAKRLGLRHGREITLSTANGFASGHTTHLATVQLGSIELEDVDGVIAPGMDGEDVLLGMSFLRRVDFSQQGRYLLLWKLDDRP